MIYLNPPEHLVLIFENFYCLTDFEFEFESVSNYLEISNYNRGDVATLAEDHYSLITRASQSWTIWHSRLMLALIASMGLA